jgi:hypothetical protein
MCSDLFFAKSATLVNKKANARFIFQFLQSFLKQLKINTLLSKNGHLQLNTVCEN